jgi:hypothetical protein
MNGTESNWPTLDEFFSITDGFWAVPVFGIIMMKNDKDSSQALSGFVF